jgi:hypothetical protein
MCLFETPALPLSWIVCDYDGNWWIVPARDCGWRDRSPYRGNYVLRSVPFFYAVGLGIVKGEV